MFFNEVILALTICAEMLFKAYVNMTDVFSR